VRPKTIVYFEWIMFGVLLLVALQWYLIWSGLFVDQHKGGRAAFITAQLFKFVLIATLTLLVSRRRSKIAMWVLIAWFALGLVLALAAHITFGTVDIINLAPLIGQVVAYGLLFTPSARRWMNREDERAKLGEVFH
jgi:hypothetical protein